VQQGIKTMEAYGVSGVPTIVVDGRYRIRNEAINSYEDLMALTEAVIQKARADHPKTAEAKKKK